MFKCGDVDSNALICSPFTGRKLKLMAREKKLVLKSWQNLPDQRKVCENIFATVLRKLPSLRNLWGLEDVCEEDLPLHKNFCLHANSFFKFLDVSVRSITLDGDYLVMCARNVGVRHCYFKGVSFDAENWLTFKNAVLDCLAQSCEATHDQMFRESWNILLTFIITEMKDAFCKETHRRHTRSSIGSDPIEKTLLAELQEKYDQCRAEDESKNDVFL